MEKPPRSVFFSNDGRLIAILVRSTWIESSMSPKGIDLIYGGRCRPNNICPSERATGNSVGFKLCSNPRARSYVTSRALDAILSATYPPIHPSRQAKNLAFSSSITSASSFPKLAISADNDADRRLWAGHYHYQRNGLALRTADVDRLDVRKCNDRAASAMLDVKMIIDRDEFSGTTMTWSSTLPHFPRNHPLLVWVDD